MVKVDSDKLQEDYGMLQMERYMEKWNNIKIWHSYLLTKPDIWYQEINQQVLWTWLTDLSTTIGAFDEKKYLLSWLIHQNNN